MWWPNPFKATSAVVGWRGSPASDHERAGQKRFGRSDFQVPSVPRLGACLGARLFIQCHHRRLRARRTTRPPPPPPPRSLLTCAGWRFSWGSRTDEEARARSRLRHFFPVCAALLRRVSDRQRPAPGTVNMLGTKTTMNTREPAAQRRRLPGGLIGRPKTIAKKLRRFFFFFEGRISYQVILLNQAGKNATSISCELAGIVFAKELMPDFARSRNTTPGRPACSAALIQLEEIRHRRWGWVGPGGVVGFVVWGVHGSL